MNSQPSSEHLLNFSFKYLAHLTFLIKVDAVKKISHQFIPFVRPLRMRSTGPGGIKITKQQSDPETLGVSRRTKYPCAPPTWRERMLPSDRKWPRFGRNLAAVAASLANTRTVSVTSDDGVQENHKEEENKMDSILKL